MSNKFMSTPERTMPYKNPNRCLSEKYFAQKDQEALAAKNSTTNGLFNLLSVVEDELLKDGIDTEDLAFLAKNIKLSPDEQKENLETDNEDDFSVLSDDFSVSTSATGESGMSNIIEGFKLSTDQMITEGWKNHLMNHLFNVN